MLKNVIGRYAAMGSATLLGYQLILDFLRHHDETNSRPMFFDHMMATTAIGTFVGAIKFNHPLHIFSAGFFSMMLLTPALWWLNQAGKMNSKRNSNIFYTNDCTMEEVERFRN